MSLSALLVKGDLPFAYGNHPDAERAIAVASAAVRDAAGSAITQETSTVVVPGGPQTLLRLPGPVISVGSVSYDGSTLTASSYEVLSEGLWRAQGWGYGPFPVTVTNLVHGLATVPADVTDLVAQLATAWLKHQDAGGGSTAGLQSVKVDDASETYTAEASGQVSPVYIPAATRAWLAARFGGGPAVVSTP